MEFATDVIILFLSSANYDLFIYLFIHSFIYLFVYLFIYLLAAGFGCEIRYVGTTELTNIPYISANVTGTINFSIKNSLRSGCQFPGREQISNLKRPLL